jgi:hypothetical protein
VGTAPSLRGYRPGMPSSPFSLGSPTALLIGTLLVAAPAPAALMAQEVPAMQDFRGPAQCPLGRISDIFIDNHSIFDPEAMPEDGRIRWAYQVANAVHIRTREEFIANQLLFQTGDCYDPARVRESARVLREFRFLASADAFSVPQPDGSRHVVVDTRDDWTTKLSLGVRVEDGLRFDGASMVEENFLGRGAAVGVFYTNRDERREAGALLEIPRLGGSGWDLEAAGGRTRVGRSIQQAVIHPFEGELGRFAFRQRVSRRQDLFTWVLPPGQTRSHLVAPLETGAVELTGAGRFGVPGHLLLLGGGFSRERIRPGTLDQVEAVIDGDFGERIPADPGSAASLAPQLRHREATRVNLLAGIRRIAFQERMGLDLLAGVQDVAVGREIRLSMGRRLGGEGPGDTFARADLFGGFAGSHTVGQFFLTVEGRREDAPVSVSRDVLGETHAFLYHQLPGRIPQTLLLRAAAQGAWRTDAPFQLTLGGPDGVRGYGDTEWAGARRVVLSVEDRIFLPGPASRLLDLGLTVFADAGRSLPGDVPFAIDSGWRGTAGLGLRLGFPPGSGTVIRADLALPLGAVASRSPILRIHAREWLGVLGHFSSQQMEQGRRSGVRGEFIGASRDRRGW